MELTPNVPRPIAAAYREACRLRTIAAARRCLHLLLEEECGLSEGRLEDQIEVLRDLHEARSTRGKARLRQLLAIERICVDAASGVDAWIGLVTWLLQDWYIDRHVPDGMRRDRRRCCGAPANA